MQTEMVCLNQGSRCHTPALVILVKVLKIKSKKVPDTVGLRYISSIEHEVTDCLMVLWVRIIGNQVRIPDDPVAV